VRELSEAVRDLFERCGLWSACNCGAGDGTCRGPESVVEAIKRAFKGPERGRESVVEAIKSVFRGKESHNRSLRSGFRSLSDAFRDHLRGRSCRKVKVLVEFLRVYFLWRP
jgi:hypothetical protein